MSSKARPRPRDGDADPVAPEDTAPEGTAPEDAATDEPVADEPERETVEDGVVEDGVVEDGVVDDDGDETPRRARRRVSLPLVPTLVVVLVVLLAGVAFLWFTRPQDSSVRTGVFAEVLAQARAGVVDLTSFDYLTLDDDIEQIRRVATGDLREESVDQLDQRRQEITDARAVVNTEVIGAGVTRADDGEATVLMVIQSTQKSDAGDQAQVVRYRIRVELTRQDGRWLLSGIAGTGEGQP